jgi:hypothetical protein
VVTKEFSSTHTNWNKKLLSEKTLKSNNKVFLKIKSILEDSEKIKNSFFQQKFDFWFGTNVKRKYLKSKINVKCQNYMFKNY